MLAVNRRFGPDLRSPYATTYFPTGERSDAAAESGTLDVGAPDDDGGSLDSLPDEGATEAASNPPDACSPDDGGLPCN